MNKGDCYVLDTGKEIYVYCGEKSKGTERLTAANAANQIRDQDHKGRGHVTKIGKPTLSPHSVTIVWKQSNCHCDDDKQTSGFYSVTTLRIFSRNCDKK